MLETNKSLTIRGYSKIDGVVAEEYSADINSTNPEDVAFSFWKRDKSLCKTNREVCRQDSANFEDMVYSIQDEMIAAKTESTVTTE